MGNTPSSQSRNNNQSGTELGSTPKHKSSGSFETTETTQTGGDIDDSLHHHKASAAAAAASAPQAVAGTSATASMGKKTTNSTKSTGAGPESPEEDGPSTPSELGDSKGKNVVDRRDDVIHPRSIIKDDQVHVNLAMADLMAYLQVVANNSNNLPVSKRDDPELLFSVSTLSSEEYARKSAAFIPADVRLICGSFLKYGKVWDLPTSEEYVASDGAQEPGRSYGGACCNSLLKVLYDAANNAADAAQSNHVQDDLFNDDDDESLATMAFTRNDTFASLDMNGQSNPSTITWATLLRQMKKEMSAIDYPQTPSITATRKFDLNQPFSLVPESFDKKNGNKRSLLIGCNYHSTDGAELKASHDDIRSMKDYIVNVHGFPETDDMMKILLDDDEHEHPTFINITEAFKSLSEQSQPGDTVFIQFSGHGGRILDAPIDSSVESYDEMLAPCDYATRGLIRDTLIFKTLLAPMRYGVTVTVLIDCCDTGMMLDLPYSWSTRADRLDSIPKMTQNDDFSFVRFLKVVKTLYEASTFTQLGKTVGTALGHQPTVQQDFDVDDATAGELTCTSREGIDGNRASKMSSSEPLFPSLCGPPPRKEDGGKKSDKDALSMLEQVFGCNFLVNEVDEALSDEETYANNTFDEHTVQNSTFDSVSEDDFRRSRGRSRRNRLT